MNKQNNNQIGGNVGLFYICYHLSRLGWNVMPTARNARGIDILTYSQDAKRTKAIQVKTLSKRSPVPLGKTLDKLMGDFLIICRTSFWLQPKQYEKEEFQEKWERIGYGAEKDIVGELV